MATLQIENSGDLSLDATGLDFSGLNLSQRDFIPKPRVRASRTLGNVPKKWFLPQRGFIMPRSLAQIEVDETPLGQGFRGHELIRYTMSYQGLWISW